MNKKTSFSICLTLLCSESLICACAEGEDTGEHKQEGQEEPKAAHLRFVGPFKDQNTNLHTNTHSSKSNH